MPLQRNKKTKLVDTIVLILLILGAVAMVFPLFTWCSAPL